MRRRRASSSAVIAGVGAALAVVGVWVGGGPAAAQTTGDSPGVVWMDPREARRDAPPSEVGLLQVEVVVADGQGRPVTGLPLEAFSVTEDGTRRRVATFRAVDLTAPPEPGAATPDARRVSTNAADAEPPPYRVFVIVFDDLHLGSARAPQARRVCEKLIVEHTRPGDRVVLVAPGESLVRSLVMPVEPEALTDAIGSLPVRRGDASVLTDSEAFRIVEKGDSAVEERVLERSRGADKAFVRSEARRVLERARGRRQRLLGALASVLEVLTTPRTLKSVLLVSEGFIHDPGDRLSYAVIAASQRAHAAVSFLDVRGLEGARGPGGTTNNPGARRSPSAAGESTGAEILATITGGHVVDDPSDLDEVLARISSEVSQHYILGYLPSGDRRGGRLRRIRVDVDRPGVTVRARRGYWDTPASGSDLHPELEAPLQEALASPALLRDVPLRLAALALAPTADGRVEVAVVSEARAGALGLQRMPDGSQGTALDLVWAVGHALPGQSQVVSAEKVAVTLPEGSPAKETWLPFERRLTLSPGLSQIKVVVRDRSSGAIGTVIHPLEVPDPARLRVSSPILSDVPEGDGVTPPRLVAHRGFAPGSVLYCYFEVFTHPESLSRSPDDDIAAYEIVDRRGEVRIRSALPLPVRGKGGGLGRLVEIPLARIEPGDYELVLELPGEGTGDTTELREPFSVTRPPRFDDDLYRAALGAYLEGDFRRAVATVLPWPSNQVRAAAKRLPRNGTALSETALLLHTDLALVLRRHGLEKAARDHFSIGRSLVEGGASRDLRRHWLLALAYEHQSQARTAEALAFYTECARAFPDAGEARLGAGTLYERAAFFPAAFGRGNLNVSPRAAARAAERSYRHALRVQPTLTEARLRLARVLQLTERADEALTELARVVEEARDPSLTALAHLFWGEISEARGEADEAVAHYRAAVAPEGSLQVAALALAQTLQSRQGWPAAVDALVPALDEEQGVGPWLAYRRGPLRLSTSPLDEMRARLRADAGGPR